MTNTQLTLEDFRQDMQSFVIRYPDRHDRLARIETHIEKHYAHIATEARKEIGLDAVRSSRLSPSLL